MRAMADSGHVTSAQHIHGYCGLWVARCGTVAVVENGGFARLEPDPAHPTDQALALCQGPRRPGTRLSFGEVDFGLAGIQP